MIVAKTRCIACATGNPPRAVARLAPQAASLNSTGSPVAARPRKLSIRKPCIVRSMRSNRRMCRSDIAIPFRRRRSRLSLAQPPHQPEKCVEAEEPERPEQQTLHEARSVEEARIPLAVGLVGVRVVPDEIRRRIRVALPAGLDEIGLGDR